MTYNHGYGRPDEIVAGIIYHREGSLLLPHSVFTVSGEPEGGNPRKAWMAGIYDFNYCRRDGTVYYHLSGGGGTFYLNRYCEPQPPPACLWYDSKLVAPTNDRIHKRYPSAATIRKWGYEIVSAPLTVDFVNGEQNPFNNAVHGEVEYCTKCHDHIPEDSLCEHIWWCEKCSVHSTPQDRCKHRRER